MITDSRQYLSDLSQYPLSEKVRIKSITTNSHLFVIQDHDEDGRLEYDYDTGVMLKLPTNDQRCCR